MYGPRHVSDSHCQELDKSVILSQTTNIIDVKLDSVVLFLLVSLLKMYCCKKSNYILKERRFKRFLLENSPSWILGTCLHLS